MAKVTSLKKSKPAFNPQASYKWEPTDLFEITGQQLAMLYHCLNKEVHSVEGATIAQKYEAHQVVMELFKSGVEQGAIIEIDGVPQQVQEVEGAVNNLFKQ